MIRSSEPSRGFALGALLGAALALSAACDDGGSIDTACDPRTDYAEDETVCCESYGLGSDGATCCYDFEWTFGSECATAEGTDGGGKQVVVDSCCEGS
jgi:hypothetical protein